MHFLHNNQTKHKISYQLNEFNSANMRNPLFFSLSPSRSVHMDKATACRCTITKHLNRTDYILVLKTSHHFSHTAVAKGANKSSWHRHTCTKTPERPLMWVFLCGIFKKGRQQGKVGIRWSLAPRSPGVFSKV